MSNDIKRKLEAVRESLPAHREVTLVAVSKYQPDWKISEAYLAGQRDFGESRVQELQLKARSLPADIRWHFIGHLQSNKVRQLLAIKSLALIQSVDSLRLLELIDREALRLGVTARVLCEVHVAREETKYGFGVEELVDWFSARGFEHLQATHIHGIMGMASNVDDPVLIEKDFQAIASCYRRIKEVAPDLSGFDTLSMGMSGDYETAIRCGSNMIRVGSSIFGDRD